MNKDDIQNLEAKLALTTLSQTERVDYLIALGRLFVATDPQQTLQLTQEAQQLSQIGEFADEPYEKGIADSQYNLGLYHFNKGEHQVSLPYFEAALTAYQQLNALYDQADTQRYLAWIMMGQEQYLQALQYLQACQAIVDQSGDQRLKGIIWRYYGAIHYKLEEYEQTIRYNKVALAFSRTHNDVQLELTSLCALGFACGRLGEIEASIEYGLEYLHKAELLQNRHHIGFALNQMVFIYRWANDYEQALEYLTRLDEHLSIYPNKLVLAEFWYGKGMVALAQDRLEPARDYLKQALTLYHEEQRSQFMYRCHQALAEIYQKLDQLDLALEHLQIFSQLKTDVIEKRYRHRLQFHLAQHQLELFEKENEIYHLKNVELTEKNRILQEMNWEKDELMKIAAHDLRNPLTTILSYTELLQYRLGANPPEKIKSDLQRISTATHKTIGIIDRLLDVNQLEEGHLRINQQACNLTDVIKKVRDSAQGRAQAKQIYLNIRLGDEDHMVWADVDILHQVLDNLVSNALKYSNPKTTVLVYTLKRDDWIRIIIKDEGLGLSVEDKQRLFQKYARLSAKPTAGESSIGLGLYVVKKFVELMGGRVSAESAGKSKGSHFIVELRSATQQ